MPNITERLEEFSKKLFDTGKRNSLVNFRHSKLSAVEIISPDISKLFRDGRRNPKTTYKVFEPVIEGVDFEDTDEDGEEKEKIKKETFISAFEGRRRRADEILLYNQDDAPFKALANIRKKGKSAIEETGVNIVYAAFGFIEWFDKEEPESKMLAPLLLVPVLIDKDFPMTSYKTTFVFGDTIVNPTFSYKLEHDESYHEPLPPFDESEGIEKYFDRVELFASKYGWSLIRECKISIFSFQKINMYRDVRDNKDKILRNPNVRALLGEVNQKSSGYEVVMTSKDEAYKNLHNVIDADSSQSEAIYSASLGKSFVLEGPPGTGKSQTITNIIAKLIYDGKRVLFVSEKLAALNVVYEKLKNVGLGEFCLELHSHKASKKELIDELCKALSDDITGMNDLDRNAIQTRNTLQNKLEKYRAALHTSINNDKNVYRLYEQVLLCSDVPSVGFSIPNIREKDEEYLGKVVKVLADYDEQTMIMGRDYRKNPLYGLKPNEANGEDKLGELFKSSEQFFGELDEIRRELPEKLGGEYNSHERISAVCEVLSKIVGSDYLTPLIVSEERSAEAIETLNTLKGIAEAKIECSKKIDEHFKEQIYVDVTSPGSKYDKLHNELTGGISRVFSLEYHGIVKQLKALRKDDIKIDYTTALKYIELLKNNNEHLARFEKTLYESGLFSEAFRAPITIDTDFDSLKKEVVGIRCTVAAIRGNRGIDLSSIASYPSDAYEKEREALKRLTERYSRAVNEYGSDFLSLCKCFDKRKCSLTTMSLLSVSKKCADCNENIDKIHEYYILAETLSKFSELKIEGIVDHLINTGYPTDKFADIYKKAYYTERLNLFSAVNSLGAVTGERQDETVSKFSELDKVSFMANRRDIRLRAASRRPKTGGTSQGERLLIGQSKKTRGQLGIRQLLSEIPELSQLLKPCFLMSPLSVSTYLAPNMEFDTVIFDEASQIFPEDAIGAIYRAKNVIVVGDSKQMPPSNFFNNIVDVEDDEAIDSVNGFESILDLALGAFDSKNLKWHYRSRSESLISFSNNHYYKGDLVTFPTPKREERFLGVEYCFVEDAVYDRKSGTNRAEAERVVDLILENIKEYPERSIGVVSFNVNQQNLIEKLIENRIKGDLSRRLYQNNGPEPFFVKNLETVQGDERDTIILSLTHAKDENGKLLLNFGPLSLTGGERRLNVAVTRAKYNLKLVTSIQAEDIDTDRAKSVGAAYLRDYLDFAKKSSSVTTVTSGENMYDDRNLTFENVIAEFLSGKGYQVDVNVGCSSYKIDLAVKVSPDSDYVMAIETDGDNYGKMDFTRDRDRLRRQILEELMGWRYYRVWSMAWRNNPETEQKRLLRALEEAKREHDLDVFRENKRIRIHMPDNTATDPDTQSDAPCGAAADGTGSEAVATDILDFDFPKYEYVDVKRIAEECGNDVKTVVKSILEVEAPISEEWLLDRISMMYGRAKGDAEAMRRFDEDMADCADEGIIRANRFIYLENEEIPDLRIPDSDSGVKRAIHHVPPEELSGGLKLLITLMGRIEKPRLFTLIASRLGYQRLTPASLSALVGALELIKDSVSIDGDNISAK